MDLLRMGGSLSQDLFLAISSHYAFASETDVPAVDYLCH
jgi:hypothetical protein